MELLLLLLCLGGSAGLMSLLRRPVGGTSIPDGKAPVHAGFAADDHVRPPVDFAARRSLRRTWFAFVWPIVVAVGAAIFCHVVRPQDRELYALMMLLMVALSFVAVPTIGRCLYRWQPANWWSELRVAVAMVLTILIMSAELYAGMCVFVYLTLSLGWIE